MKIIVIALAIHSPLRKRVARLVVRGHLSQGEIESVTKVGIETRTGIETETRGIETDMNGLETVNGIANETANETVTTAVTRTMGGRVVHSSPLYSPYVY